MPYIFELKIKLDFMIKNIFVVNAMVASIIWLQWLILLIWSVKQIYERS